MPTPDPSLEDRPLRVLWLVKGLGPGGAERLLVHSAILHDRERVDGRVGYLLPWKRHLVDEIERAGVPTTCLDARGSADVRWVHRLRCLLANEPVDVVHAHSPLAAIGARVVVRTMPRDRRPVLVTTEHNLWNSYARTTARVHGWTAPLDDARFAVSVAVRDGMPERLQASTEVVYHGIDVAALRAAAARDATRAAIGAGDDVVVCTVANLRGTKGYPDLLAAARQVCDRVEGVRFVAVGQGPDEEELRALHRRLGLGDRFQLLGYRTDVPQLMSASDIFCLASHHEGLPISLMEALALGLPVVATAVGGIPELVDDGREAVLVAPGRPELLADALVALATDPGRRAAMAARAQERSATLSAEHAVRRTEALYRELVRP